MSLRWRLIIEITFIGKYQTARYITGWKILLFSELEYFKEVEAEANDKVIIWAIGILEFGYDQLEFAPRFLIILIDRNLSIFSALRANLQLY